MTSEHFWDGYKHETLYDMIHGRGGFFHQDGAGAAGATEAQSGWGELAALMDRARDRTEMALSRAGVAWEGAAADAMRSGVTPLARWAADANTAGAATQSSVDIHVNSFTAAQHSMPEPVPVTSTANSDFAGIPAAFTHLFGGQTDQDRQEAAAQEAKAEAVRVMSAFDGESGQARSSVGRFVPPPPVTVAVAPPQPGTTELDSQRWPGAGQPAGPDTDGPRATSDGEGGTRTPATAPPPGGGTTPAGTTPAGTFPSGTFPSGTVPPGTAPPGTAPSSTPPVTTPQQSSTWLPTGQQPGTTPPTGYRNTGPGGTTTGRVPTDTPGVGTGRGPGGAGRGAGTPGGGRGALPLSGTSAAEPGPGRPGPGGARGSGGMGMGPMGAGRSQGDEDKEHHSPEYLRATHDSFWDDTDPVAPPVIGEDDD